MFQDLLRQQLTNGRSLTKIRLLVWSVCLICFFGGFRIHEILSRTSTTFDPVFTLLGRDIKVVNLNIKGKTVSVLQVLIKSPKEDRIGREFVIDVYENQGSFCPVKYFKKWQNSSTIYSSRKPAFLTPNGSPFTGNDFNKILRVLLSPYIDYGKTKISTHSFRGGMASLLGQIGFSDEEIQAMGRWSSRAFESYLKLPRTKRAAMARKLASFCI